MALFGTRFADGQTVDIDGLALRLRVSVRATRVSLRFDRIRREAIAVAPSARRLSEAVAFARSRRDWLAARLAETPVATPSAALTSLDAITVLGESWRLRPDGRRPRLSRDADDGRHWLAGCGQGTVDPQLVARAIRREAETVFDHRAAIHCAALGTPKPPISLTDARTRWGSCTPAGQGRAASIRLSWRLALAPWDVADYVVAHECAHLREANHGPRFWAHVHDLVGEPRRRRAWLRTHGAALHAVFPKTAS
jgi:predicted metal-dependent hydrolase